MEENKITTDDLRRMLDVNPSGQCMEGGAKAVSEGAKALADATVSLKEALSLMSSMTGQISEATTVKIPYDAIRRVRDAGEEAGETAARIIRDSVSEAMAEAKIRMKHVSMPASVATCLLILMLALVSFTVYVLVGNHALWHIDMIWEMAWKLGGGMTLFIVMTLWACHKEWM